MSLPFRLDQADGLVVTKEDRLSLSVNAKPIETVVSFFLSVRSIDRHCDSEMSCEPVSASQRANTELSSKLLRSYAAVAWIKEMKCLYSALHTHYLLKFRSQTHSWTAHCISCLWSISVSSGIGRFVLGTQRHPSHSCLSISIFQVYRNWLHIRVCHFTFTRINACKMFYYIFYQIPPFLYVRLSSQAFIKENNSQDTSVDLINQSISA